MGWLKALANDHDSRIITKDELDNETLHIEDISPASDQSDTPSICYQFAPLDTANEGLPFISAAKIQNHDLKQHSDSSHGGQLLLVIDNIVYDCTQFINEHPGGHRVIENFRGQDCTWQFWRFHSKQILEDWGKSLRIGRTQGAKNRWKERPRFVGLRRLGGRGEDDW